MSSAFPSGSSPSTSASSLSSPQSNDSSEQADTSKCQVCYQTAHGNHFGANTCRACAAFFRRINLATTENLSCRLSKNKCQPNEEGRWFCKKCRWKKCLSLNMVPDNIQHNRDLFSTSEKFKRKGKRNITDESPKPMFKDPVLTPRFIKCTTWENSPSGRTCIDMTALVENAKGLLLEVPIINQNFSQMNALEKLTYGLNQIRKSQKTNLMEIRKVGQAETLTMWEMEVCKPAKWLMYCDEFRTLTCDQRLDILKSMWHIWNRIERLAMTAQMRTNKTCGESIFVVTHEHFVDYNFVELNGRWMSDHNNEQLKYYTSPVSGWFNEGLIPQFLKLEPSDVELTYMLCHLCFHITGKLLGGEIQEVTDRLQDIMADNLHNYYINQGNASRYSARLKKLLNITCQYQKTALDRQKKFEVGAVFDVFRLNFSHPEMFRNSC